MSFDGKLPPLPKAEGGAAAPNTGAFSLPRPVFPTAADSTPAFVLPPPVLMPTAQARA